MLSAMAQHRLPSLTALRVFETLARQLSFTRAARELGVTSEDISSFLAMTLSGYTVTQYRERDKLISVDLRAPKSERVDPANLLALAMPTPNGAVPLGTLGHLRNDLEYGVIWERDRQPTITITVIAWNARAAGSAKATKFARPSLFADAK